MKGILLNICAAAIIYFIPQAVFAEETPQNDHGDLSINAVIDSVEIICADTLVIKGVVKGFLSAKGEILNKGLVEHDINFIKDYLYQNGWWNGYVNANADTTKSIGLILKFTIETNSPVFFGLITYEITGKNELEKTVRKDHYGKRFTKEILDSLINDKISQYSSEGYSAVKAQPLFYANKDTINVVLQITTGVIAHVDSIIVRGLVKTKNYVAKREFKYLIGRQADINVTTEADLILSRLEFIAPGEKPVIEYTDDGKSVLVVNAVESSQGTFDGLIGYQPAQSGKSGIIGKIDFSLNNMFGTGRYSKVRWESLGEKTEDLELQYKEPWVFGYPYDISFAFTQEERGLQGYTKTLFNFGVGRNFGKLHITAGLRYEKVSADSLTSSGAKGIDTSIVWSGTDNPVNPTHGIKYSAVWSAIAKKYRFGDKDNARLERTEFDLEHYVRSFNKQVIALNVSYRKVDTPLKTLSLSDRYWIGGASSIRGYREKSYPALNAIWSTVEYRFLTGKESRVFVFCDTGYLSDKIKKGTEFTDKNTTLVGYGFGLRLKSQAGNLGFDYGIEKGGGLGSGKLHLRLTTNF